MIGVDSYFNPQNNGLTEGVALQDIASAVGTPCYVYSVAALHAQWQAIVQAFAVLETPPQVAFAVKACPELAVVAQLAQWGAGADVVSVGEMQRALRAGVAPQKIVFSGCGKTQAELQAAVMANIGTINVESANELQTINTLAQRAQRRVNVQLRLNPDVAAHTHTGIATGRRDDKFGIGLSAFYQAYAQATALPWLNVQGVAVHIGSQIFDLSDYAAAYTKLAQVVHTLRGQGLNVTHLDLGGGFGSPYAVDGAVFDWAGYVQLLQRIIAPLNVHTTIEPGRFLVANAGALLTQVVDVKRETGRRAITVVDAAMNDLMRPAMYHAVHHISLVQAKSSGKIKEQRTAVVGGICESSDCFAKLIKLPVMQTGDLLVLHSAGAYGASMSSAYNTRAPAPAVLVQGNTFKLIRRRLTLDELLQAETL